ncbi:MAG: hypothetical protein WEA09_04600 [Gemmatimonadota bacterium]
MGSAAWALLVTSPERADAQRSPRQPRAESGLAQPPGLEVIPDSSYLVVITRRAGAAARLAHDHLIAARGWEMELQLPPDQNPKAVSFHLTVPVDSLVVDDPELKDRLEDRLQLLGIIPGAFSSTSADDRRDIREAMVAENQLNALTHPLVEVRLVSARQEPDHPDFPFGLTVELSAAGGATVGEMRGRVVEAEGRVHVEAYGPVHFTQLGIEPYSAFWGLVRNQDRFYLYLSLRAARNP